MEETEPELKQIDIKPDSVSMCDKDESGYSEDISCCSLDDKSGTSVDLEAQESGIQVTPKVSTFSKASESSLSDNNISLVGLKKDDSGIYSERSPSLCLTKESSDGDLSESMCGSLDENTDIRCSDSTVKWELNNLADEFNGIEGPQKASGTDNLNKMNGDQMCADNDKMEDNDSDHFSGNNNAVNKTVDTTESTDCNLKQTEPVDSQSTNKPFTCDIDNDSNSDDDDGNFVDFVRKTAKSGSHVRKLVDYDSESDGDSMDESKIEVKGRRQYRKRKPESTSDNDDGDNDDNKNGDEVSTELNSGSPILLRHSSINENSINNNVDVSDLSSDSSEESHLSNKVKYDSSESETDDVPPSVSQYGPPKHKWRALSDLRNREFGFSPTDDPGYFRKRVQGSLQMVQRFNLQFKMDSHEGCVNALHFNRIGTLLASGSDDLNIVIWNWIHNRPAIVYDSGHRSNVFQAKFMPFSGDCHVVSCARDGQVRLADLSSTGVCKATKKIAQHKGSAHKLSLEMDSAHVLLSAGEDAVTYEIDLRQDKANKIVTTKEKDKKVPIYSIHSNPVNSNEFCVGGRDHFIRVYDKRKINEEVNDGLLKKFAPHHIVDTEKEHMKANVTCACYNYNGTEILGTYNDEDIYLFNNLHSDNADYIHRYRGHRNNQTVKGVNFYGPESEFIVSGSDCGHIFLWDKPTENIVQFMEGDEGGVINVLEPHPFAPVLATSGLDHDVKIWAPTAENPTDLKGLSKLMKRNAREREEERSGDGGMIDGSMLWFIMHHLRRGRRQRAREARAARGEPVPDDDTSDTLSDEDLTTDDDSDNEGLQRDPISCAPS
ncbi:DDB1- and CUL4-associated factor 8 [Mactra antiquata]